MENKNSYVTCTVCRKIFTNCFSAPTNQAYGCASDYDKEKITCHYGSGFDTDKYIVNCNIVPETGVICDECIQGMIDLNSIVKDENYNYWAALDPYLGHIEKEISINDLLSLVTYNVMPTQNSFKTESGHIFYWNIYDCENYHIGHVIFDDSGAIFSFEFLNDAQNVTVSYRWISDEFRDDYAQNVLDSGITQETTQEGFKYIDLTDIQEAFDKLSQSYQRKDLVQNTQGYDLIEKVFFQMNKPVKTGKLGNIVNENVVNQARSSRFAY